MNALGIFTSKSFEFSQHLILEKAADVTIKNYSGNNIFHNLAMMSHRNQMSMNKFGDYEKYRKQKKFNKTLYRSFFELYISNGIDINEKNVAGDTPLSIALREKNFLFLELLTQEANLDVDHLVHDKSELHFFKSVVFDRRAPDLLRQIIGKSKDFGLLMQLFNLDNGYNAFHSILNHVATEYYNHMNQLKSSMATKYQNYLQHYNSKSLNKLEHEAQNEIEEESDNDEQGESKGLDIESPTGDEEFVRVQKRVEQAKANYAKKSLKKHLLALLKAKSELYQPKFQGKILGEMEEALKERVIEMFDTFHAEGYDFGEKVRLYKKTTKEKGLVEKAKMHVHSFGRQVTPTPKVKERVTWRNKNYSVNVDAKSSVFHLVMKRANLFLFEYFFDKVDFVKNECNFLGNSLIHNLVKNFDGVSPKMDLKVFNEDYDRNRQKELEREKKKNLKRSKLFENKQQEQKQQTNTFSGYTTFGKKRAARKFTGVKRPRKAYNPYKISSRKKQVANVPTTPANPKLEEQTIFVLNKLLELHEDPDLQNKAGEYPILKVCQNGGSDLLHLMVSSGANLNVIDRRGKTPLLQFAKRRDVHSCEYLLANGAQINLVDHKQRNALHWSLNETTPENSSNFDLEEVLIKGGVNVNQKDVHGKSPIFYLFTKIKNEFINEKLDPIEIFSYLLSMGKADLKITDSNGNQLIHFCAQRGSYLCMIYLLRAGVDVKVVNNHQNSALNISILNNQNDVAIILLQHNSEVNSNIQMVDYESLKKYKKLMRKEKKEAKKKSQSLAIEEEKSESEKEELEEELEDQDGLVPEAIEQKFREDDESEDEDEWADYVQQWEKGRRKKKKPFEHMQEESDEEEEEDNQGRGYNRFGGFYGQKTTFGMSSWQRRSMRNQLQQTLKEKQKKANENKKLKELAKNNFVMGKESQFKIALKNAMLSVNFLLVDFAFNIGRALMDTFSLKNWDYSKTLLNKKVLENQFISKDSKKRTALHYLAFFGNMLDTKTLDYFIERLLEKGVDIRAKDCMHRKAVHYAALSGNLAFILLVKDKDPQLHEKDILGNSLLSLYLQSHSISKEKLESFVQDYKNDVNVVFKVANDDFMKEIESFDEFAYTDGNPEKHLKKLLKIKPKSLPWFDAERKFREGETVPKAKTSPFKIFTPLIYLTQEKKNLTLTEHLIEMGANVNLKDENGETILAKAILANNLDTLEVLKKYSNLIDFSTGKFKPKI